MDQDGGKEDDRRDRSQDQLSRKVQRQVSKSYLETDERPGTNPKGVGEERQDQGQGDMQIDGDAEYPADLERGLHGNALRGEGSYAFWKRVQ